MRRSIWLVVVVAACFCGSMRDGHAQSPAEDNVEQARRLYEQGIEWVKQHEWGRALEAFERSEDLRPHAVTSYNIGACYRAIGRYTRARRHFSHALKQHDDKHSNLPDHLIADSRRYLAEVERLLARVQLTVTPPDARVAVDGAPLAREGSEGKLARMVAGTQAAGRGARLPARTVTVLVDPGAHVILLSRKGFADVVRNRTFAPGARAKLTLELDRLPARLRITADHEQARVELEGQLVGLAPLDLQRPPGSYRVRVSADGREPYETQVKLTPGEEVALRAKLAERTPSIAERWWFWTAAGVVVTGAVIGTYFAVRPEPERPPLDGGGLGWTVPLR